MWCKLKGLSSKEAETESAQLLQRLQLSDKKNQFGSQLSGGMKRKLCLSIALIGGSEVSIITLVCDSEVNIITVVCGSEVSIITFVYSSEVLVLYIILLSVYWATWYLNLCLDIFPVYYTDRILK